SDLIPSAIELPIPEIFVSYRDYAVSKNHLRTAPALCTFAVAWKCREAHAVRYRTHDRTHFPRIFVHQWSPTKLGFVRHHSSAKGQHNTASALTRGELL